MKGLEKILTHIEATNASAVEEILSGVSKRGKEILAAGQKEAAETYERLTKEADEKARAIQNREWRVAVMESKHTYLAFKQDLLSRAFEVAREKLKALPDAAYIDFVVKTLIESINAKDTKTLIFNAADSAQRARVICEKANALLKESGATGSFSVAEETRDILGGVIVVDAAGEVNLSFESILKQKKLDLDKKLAAMLFEESDKAMARLWR